MTRERHARVKEIFVRVVECPADKRPDLIAQECRGDDDLRREVERLLSFHTEQTISPQFVGAEGLPPKGDSARFGDPPVQAPNLRPSSASEATTLRFNAGAVVANRFRIVAPVGVGGMGVVFRADDLVLRGPVALKFLRPVAASLPVWVRKFRREVRTALTITHPNVCRVFDIVESDGLCFISMEYVDGENLATLIQRAGRLPRERFVEVATQICLGLAAAHDVGVVHRDLKPANIMIDGKGNVRITDFGLSGTPRDIPAGERIAGTPAYMAPEQFSGREMSVRTDLYALGLVLYEMVCGRPAFSAENTAEYAKLQSASQPPLPSSIANELDPQIERIILQCLEKSPASRPSSALEVAAALPGADALALALAARVTPPPDTVSSARPRTLRQRQVTVVLVATVAMLAILAALRGFAPMAWEKGATKPMATLAQMAEELLSKAGYRESTKDSALGFVDAAEISTAFQTEVPTLRPVDVANSTPAFWYRAGMRLLVPQDARSFVFRGGRVRATDPPLWVPGSAIAVLDLDGRLSMMHATADGWPMTDQPTGRESADWSVLLNAAGVHEPTVVQNKQSLHDRTGVQNIEWRGSDQRVSSDQLVAIGHSYAGRPTHFAVGSVAEAKKNRRYDALLFTRALSNSTVEALFALLILIAVPLAWFNHRRRRTDPVGAWRLAVVVFAIQITTWALRARLRIPIPDLIGNLLVVLVASLGVSALAGVLYIALEPIARKHWPHPLITWTRLLSARFRDPHVGQHLLVGVSLGVLVAVFMAGERFVVRAAGWAETPPVVRRLLTDSLVGGSTMLAGLAQAVPDAVLRAMLWLLLVATLRSVLRRPAAAIVFALFIVTLLLMPRGASLQTAWLMALLTATLSVYVATHFGVLSLAAGMFTADILTQTPIVVFSRTEFPDATLAGLGVVLLMATVGFLNARRLHEASS